MNIPYQRFTFTIEAKDPLVLPAYKGATLRGGFGSSFRRVVCALRQKDCRDCLLRTRCIYAYVFETAPESDASIMHMGAYEKVPHPFVIEPPAEPDTTFVPGDLLSFGLVLVGRATDYLPYFVYTFEELGRTGIGKARGGFHLKEVTCGEETIYSSESKVLKNTPRQSLEIGVPETGAEEHTRDLTIEFLTPVRIAYQRRLATTLPFHVLIRSLLRRLCLLSYFHCGGQLPEWDHRALIRSAEAVSVTGSTLSWWDWERYSSRQKTTMMMGGLKGTITYRGNLKRFLPFLAAGEVFHIGKSTSFGLGKFRLTDPRR